MVHFHINFATLSPTERPIFLNFSSFLFRFPQRDRKLSVLLRGKLKMKTSFQSSNERTKFFARGFSRKTKPTQRNRASWKENSLREISPAAVCVRAESCALLTLSACFDPFESRHKNALHGKLANRWKIAVNVFNQKDFNKPHQRALTEDSTDSLVSLFAPSQTAALNLSINRELKCGLV